MFYNIGSNIINMNIIDYNENKNMNNAYTYRHTEFLYIYIMPYAYRRIYILFII